MKYEWFDAYCQSKPGAVKEYKAEWEAMRYLVGGRMFVMQCEDNKGRLAITLKCDPLHGQMLRDQFDDIRPGYYMNKLHWNSVDANGDVPDDVLRQMADESYRLVLGGLSKRAQREICGE